MGEVVGPQALFTGVYRAIEAMTSFTIGEDGAPALITKKRAPSPEDARRCQLCFGLLPPFYLDLFLRRRVAAT